MCLLSMIILDLLNLFSLNEIWSFAYISKILQSWTNSIRQIYQSYSFWFRGRLHIYGFLRLFIKKGELFIKIFSTNPTTNWNCRRKNQHIIKTVQVIESMVPYTFWCEAAHMIVHLINRPPSTTLKMLLLRVSLWLASIFLLACLWLPLLCRSSLTWTNKIFSSSCKIFIGYSDDHKGFLCYFPEACRTHISWNVVFLEHIPYYSL